MTEHIETGDASAPRRSAPNALNTSTSTNKNIFALAQWRRVAMSLPSPRRERLLMTCAQLERVYRAEEVQQ